MIKRGVSVDNLSTLSATHARREEDSIVDDEVSKLMKNMGIKDETKTIITDSKQLPNPISMKPRADTPARFNTPTTDLDELYYQRPTAPPISHAGVQMPYVTSLMVPIPKYDLNDVSKWLEVYTHVATVDGLISDQQKFDHLFQAFHGTPHLEYFLRLRRTNKITNWKNAQEVFLLRSADPDTTINASRILLRKQKPEEEVCLFITKQEYDLSKLGLNEDFIVNQIIFNLQPKLRDKILENTIENPIKSVDDLIQKASLLEQLLRSIETQDEINKGKRMPKRVEFETENKTEIRDLGDEAERQRRSVGYDVRNLTNQIRYMQRSIDRLNAPQFQNRIQRPNVPWNHGPPRNNNNFVYRQAISQPNAPPTRGNNQLAIQTGSSTQNSNSNVERNTEGSVRCFNCQQYGHYARNCTKPRRQQPANPNVQRPVSGNATQ